MKTKLIVIGLVLLVGTFLFPVFHVVESHQPVFEDDEVISWKERTWEEFLKEENMSEEAISEGYRHFFILTPPKFVSLSEIKKGFEGGQLAGQNYKPNSY